MGETEDVAVERDGAVFLSRRHGQLDVVQTLDHGTTISNAFAAITTREREACQHELTLGASTPASDRTACLPDRPEFGRVSDMERWSRRIAFALAANQIVARSLAVRSDIPGRPLGVAVHWPRSLELTLWGTGISAPFALGRGARDRGRP